MLEIIPLLKMPFNAMGDALELRRLRRRLPFVHRRLISVFGEMHAEPDADYLGRLRDVYDERYGLHDRG